jgi:hypothetical protein
MEASENLFVTRAMKFNLGLFPPALCVLGMKPNAFIAAGLPSGKHVTQMERVAWIRFLNNTSLLKKNFVRTVE